MTAEEDDMTTSAEVGVIAGLARRLRQPASRDADGSLSYAGYLRVKNGISDSALLAAGLMPADQLSYDDYVAAFGAGLLKGQKADAPSPVVGLPAPSVLDVASQGTAQFLPPDPTFRVASAPVRWDRYMLPTLSAVFGIGCVFLTGAALKVTYPRQPETSEMAAPTVPLMVVSVLDPSVADLPVMAPPDVDLPILDLEATASRVAERRRNPPRSLADAAQVAMPPVEMPPVAVPPVALTVTESFPELPQQHSMMDAILEPLLEQAPSNSGAAAASHTAIPVDTVMPLPKPAKKASNALAISKPFEAPVKVKVIATKVTVAKPRVIPTVTIVGNKPAARKEATAVPPAMPWIGTADGSLGNIGLMDTSAGPLVDPPQEPEDSDDEGNASGRDHDNADRLSQASQKEPGNAPSGAGSSDPGNDDPAAGGEELIQLKRVR